METPSSPSYVIIAFDATKSRNELEFWVTLNNVQARGDILRGGDTIVVLGVLHKVTHPSKCLTLAFPFYNDKLQLSHLNLFFRLMPLTSLGLAFLINFKQCTCH